MKYVLTCFFVFFLFINFVNAGLIEKTKIIKLGTDEKILDSFLSQTNNTFNSDLFSEEKLKIEKKRKKNDYYNRG